MAEFRVGPHNDKVDIDPSNDSLRVKAIKDVVIVGVPDDLINAKTLKKGVYVSYDEWLALEDSVFTAMESGETVELE